MKKIWEYISARSKFVLSIRQVMSATTIAIGCFHVFLLLFFAYFKIYPMVVVNILSICIYIFCFVQTRSEKNNLLRIFDLAYMEVLIHSVIATIMLGIDSGFTLYLVAMIPLGYYSAYNFRSRKKHANPMFYVLSSGGGFLLVRFVCNYIDPLYTYGNPQVDKIIYMVNYFMIIIAMVAFLSTLLNQTRTLEELRLRQNKKLEMLSKIDPLTGLVNRRSIQERCQQSESLSEEYTVILGDIDDFKHVNDTYGHDVGDEVLKAVADVFKVSVRSDDIVCRWGGEEVLVFLPRCTRADAVLIAERILERIRALEFNIEGKELLQVTMTLGVSVSSEAADFAGVTKKADERLYEGKHNGKNQVISHRKSKEIKNIS